MYPFVGGCTHILVGSSGSGKTTYLRKLLQNLDVMWGKEPPIKIRYHYGVYQQLFDEIKKELKEIEFVEGLPTLDDIMEFTTPGTHTLMCIDDLQSQAVDNEVVEQIFTKFAHHRSMTCVLFLQNLYAKGKRMRTIHLNTHYITMFRSPRDSSQLRYLGQQIFPTCHKILTEASEDILREAVYGYLIVDLTPHTPQTHRVRTRIFPNEYTRVYIPKSLSMILSSDDENIKNS